MVQPSQVRAPGVYRYDVALIDGRPAFYTVDWHGVESDLRVVGEDETVDGVIQDLAEELGAAMPTPAGASGRPGRPPLFLV